jgi:hypothetical protein
MVRLAVAAVLCAGVATLATAAPGGQAATAKPLNNSTTFPDSVGEDALGPDVVSVVVSNDDKGNLTIVINIPNRPTFASDMLLQVFVDSDANPLTGDPDSLGADYVIQLEAFGGPAEVGLFRWNGTVFSSLGVPQASLIFSYANGATIKISAAELGNTKRFNFAVIALSGLVVTPTGDIDDTNAHVDLAPDPGHGFFTYDVKITPPTLVVRSSGTKPLTPRSGKPFTVFLVAARSDTGALIESGNVTCKARIAFKSIRANSSNVVNGRATCTWLIPKTARGKTLRGSITVVSGGLKKTRTFSVRIG